MQQNWSRGILFNTIIDRKSLTWNHSSPPTRFIQIWMPSWGWSNSNTIVQMLKKKEQRKKVYTFEWPRWRDVSGGEPALVPLLAAAFLRPIFFIIKLEPMKMLEERASTSPITLSLDIPMMCHTNNEKKKKNAPPRVLELKNQACRAKMSNPMPWPWSCICIRWKRKTYINIKKKGKSQMQKCNNALEIIKKSKTKENDTFLGTLQTSSVAKTPSSYHRIRMKNWSGWCNVDFRLWCLGGTGVAFSPKRERELRRHRQR